MFALFLASTGLGALHLVATVLFLLVFVAVLAHTFLGRGSAGRYERLARLPLEADGAADTSPKGVTE